MIVTAPGPPPGRARRGAHLAGEVRLEDQGPAHRRPRRRSPTAPRRPACPTPAQSAADGAVFPVVGAHNFGGPENRFGAPRDGYVHQGQDVLTAEGTPVVARYAGHDPTTSYQAGGAGYYLVEHTHVGLRLHVRPLRGRIVRREHRSERGGRAGAVQGGADRGCDRAAPALRDVARRLAGRRGHIRSTRCPIWKLGTRGRCRVSLPRGGQRGASIGRRGEIAQLVEHTTENRGVPGSSPGLAISRCPCTPGERRARASSAPRACTPAGAPGLVPCIAPRTRQLPGVRHTGTLHWQASQRSGGSSHVIPARGESGEHCSPSCAMERGELEEGHLRLASLRDRLGGARPGRRRGQAH